MAKRQEDLNPAQRDNDTGSPGPGNEDIRGIATDEDDEFDDDDEDLDDSEDDDEAGL
jgi:hypothetical protein